MWSAPGDRGWERRLQSRGTILLRHYGRGMLMVRQFDAEQKILQRERCFDMSDHDVLANQKLILENQKTILANQGVIQQNQERIKKNQHALDHIQKNQDLIL